MTAQAMATTARCNFFSVKGGELLNMYVGESERNVRQLFERARRAAPSIIFFDELDAIGGGRSSMSSSAYGGGDSGGGTKIIQALLTEIDGFDSRPGVMVVGATNRPDLIDSALLRPGRIDQIHYIAPPDASARKAILSKLIDSKKDYTAGLVDAVPRLVELTEGFSGAELTQAWQRTLLDVSVRESEVQKSESAILYIKEEDLEKSIRNMDKQITPQMLDGYESWRRRFKMK